MITQDSMINPTMADGRKDNRPGVAIICNSVPPYRIHLHCRIVKEIPEINLWTLVTYNPMEGMWNSQLPAEIQVVCFDPQTLPQHGERLNSMWREWRKGGRIISWLSQQNIRAVVVSGYSDLCRYRVISWCRRNRVPCFLAGDSNARADTTQGLRYALKKAFLTRIVRKCHGVMPFGTLGQEYYARYGASSQRMFLFPLEPDYGLVQNITAEQMLTAQKRFGLGEGRRRLVYSGRFVPVKRVDLLIDAFVQLADRRPEWDLLLIGDGPLRQMLGSRVPQHLYRRIIWTGFLGEQDVISALYRVSDVLVLPSDFEPWALVINEATAAGLAVVCSDIVGAAADLVQDGMNGRIFAKGNRESLLECLVDVTDPGRIDRMKAASTGILTEWRKHSDPVSGLRSALVSAHIL
jgi:glycosyltransferase involved in cell wall biosynthesis